MTIEELRKVFAAQREFENADRRERSDRSKVHLQDIDEETGEVIDLVDRAYAKECDINLIVDRFMRTGEMLPPAPEGLQYGDDTARPRYEESKKLVLESEAWFESLPAKLRRRFDNQLSVMMEFMENSDNYEEAKELGIIPSEKAVENPSSGVPPEPLLDINGGTDTKTVV